MTSPKAYTAKLEDKLALNEKYTHFFFELVEPHELKFLPGQYVSIQVDDTGSRRSYSIASSPAIDHGFELLIDLGPCGLGCTYLNGLKFGEEIQALGPMGNFILQPVESAAESIVMIATGSGIAPFRAMIIDLLQVQQVKNPITLYWGMRFENQLFWLDEFQELMDSFPNFKLHPVISKAGSEWPLCRGRVTDCLVTHGLPQAAKYYLCGNKPMIEESSQILVSAGIKPEQIYHEKFW